MDGHYYVGNSDAMVCHSTPVELVKTLPHIAMGPVTTESYRFKRIFLDHGDSEGVWAHESLITPGDVLRALIEGYRKAKA